MSRSSKPKFSEIIFQGKKAIRLDLSEKYDSIDESVFVRLFEILEGGLLTEDQYRESEEEYQGLMSKRTASDMDERYGSSTYKLRTKEGDLERIKDCIRFFDLHIDNGVIEGEDVMQRFYESKSRYRSILSES